MVKFSGTERINAEPARVWSFLMDPTRFTACAPAMKNVKIKNEQEFTFDIAAPGRTITFNAKWEERDEPSFARLRMEGGGRLSGGARLNNEFRISLEDGSASSVAWSSDVNVFGAARLILSDDRLRSLVEEVNQDVIACIREQIESG
jgi:uncharacterized protein